MYREFTVCCSGDDVGIMAVFVFTSAVPYVKNRSTLG